MRILKLNIQLGKKFNDPLNYDLAETVGIGTESRSYIVLRWFRRSMLMYFEENLENIAKWNYQIVKASKYRQTLLRIN